MGMKSFISITWAILALFHLDPATGPHCIVRGIKIGPIDTYTVVDSLTVRPDSVAWAVVMLHKKPNVHFTTIQCPDEKEN